MDETIAATRSDVNSSQTSFWLRPASYWLPAHYPTSAWVTHAPFAAWLVDVLQPHSIVELGTHYGFSCFAFAEAAKKRGLPVVVSALDSWEGDDHAGHYGEEVHDYVRGVAEFAYPQSVRMLRGYFTDSRHHFQNGSVDLLHIDGRHSYEDVSADYAEWRDTVREGGVILFHDIAERENGFGVWRLWEELAEPGRSFTFDHGHGLGVLAVGEIAPGPLADLFGVDESTAAHIRADFVRLGEVVSRQEWLESLPAELERVWAEVRERALHEDQQAAALSQQHEYIDSLTTSTSWRITAPLRAVGRLRPRRD